MEAEKDFLEARRRVHAKIGFLIHLFFFCVVNAGLILLNLNIGAEYFWAKWPLIGWGFGLAMHGIGIYMCKLHSRPSFITNWRDKMIEKELAK